MRYTQMTNAIEIFASQGIVAFSVNIAWDPAANFVEL